MHLLVTTPCAYSDTIEDSEQTCNSKSDLKILSYVKRRGRPSVERTSLLNPLCPRGGFGIRERSRVEPHKISFHAVDATDEVAYSPTGKDCRAGVQDVPLLKPVFDNWSKMFAATYYSYRTTLSESYHSMMGRFY